MVVRVLSIAIVLVQLFDVAIHAATDQLEPLRVASNVVILVWAALALSGRFDARFRIAVASIGAYLALNVLFLAREGVTNPAQGGEFRTMLFLLVLLTTALSVLVIALRRERGSQVS